MKATARVSANADDGDVRAIELSSPAATWSNSAEEECCENMAGNDIKFGDPNRPAAAHAANASFEPVPGLSGAHAPVAEPRFSRRQLLVAFVAFNLLVWTIMGWLVLS